ALPLRPFIDVYPNAEPSHCKIGPEAISDRLFDLLGHIRWAERLVVTRIVEADDCHRGADIVPTTQVQIVNQSFIVPDRHRSVVVLMSEPAGPGKRHFLSSTVFTLMPGKVASAHDAPKLPAVLGRLAQV